MLMTNLVIKFKLTKLNTSPKYSVKLNAKKRKRKRKRKRKNPMV